MPKLKTNRSAAKRFRATGSGKIKRSCKNRRHILTKKSPKRKRQLRKTQYVDSANMYNVQRLVPHIA